MRPPRSLRPVRIGMAFAAVATLLLGTSACSTGSADTGSGVTTLTYWASNQGESLDADKAALDPVLANFTTETGIDVKLEVIGLERPADPAADGRHIGPGSRCDQYREHLGSVVAGDRGVPSLRGQ